LQDIGLKKEERQIDFFFSAAGKNFENSLRTSHKSLRFSAAGENFENFGRANS